MATQGLTSTYNGQTESPVAKDWTTITGTYIETALDTVQFTEEVFFRAVYTFTADVVVSSVSYSVSGSLSAGGLTAANFYVYSGNVGSIGSSFTFNGAVNVSSWSLVGRTLTVDINVACSPYTGSPPTLRVDNPTFTVTYEPLPLLHNLGINF